MKTPAEFARQTISPVERTHQGKMCNGRTPVDTFLDGLKIWAEKIDQLNHNNTNHDLAD